jgi:YcxB-like protein
MDQTVTYRYGWSDYFAMQQALFSLSLLGRLGRWRKYIFAAAMMVFFNLVDLLSSSFDLVINLVVSAVGFLAALLGAAIGELLSKLFFVQYTKFLFPRLSVANKDCTLTFGEEGIRSKYGDIEGRLPWRSIKNVLATKDYLFLSISRMEMLLVPRRALPSDDAATALATYIRSKVAAASAA